jgi:DNA polymerase-3 subunit alpha
VKNVGQGAVEAIIAARNEGGEFRSIHQFTERVDLGSVNKRVIESLVKSGALDSFRGTRPQLLLAIDGAVEAGMRSWRDRQSGQEGLFGGFTMAETPEPPLPKAGEWTLREKLAGEKEMIGFYVSGHPLDDFREKIAEVATRDSANMEGLEKGTDLALCGMLSGIQRRRNREGKPWASMVLEDRSGSVEAMVFTTAYEALAPLLQEDQPVLARGSALPEEGAATKISIKEIIPLHLVRVSMPSLISIKVPVGRNGLDRAQELRGLFDRKPGETQVRLRLESARDFSVILDVSAKVRPDKEFQAEVVRICGRDMLEILGN